jgi:hypothetical protein
MSITDLITHHMEEANSGVKSLTRMNLAGIAYQKSSTYRQYVAFPRSGQSHELATPVLPNVECGPLLFILMCGGQILTRQSHHQSLMAN